MLTGCSGAGKSSFLRSLLDELADDHEVRVLVFDAAQFKADFDLEAHVGGALRGQPGRSSVACVDLWTEMDRLVDSAPRRFVLVLDEVNEFARPTELLRQVNELIGCRPWLKVALASRPEAWWSMWRATPLKGRHFFVPQPSLDAAQNERPPLSAWDLQPFSSQEAQAAYARYQAAYRLETDYAALSRETRELIREPLILWLIAATYDARAVSTALRRDRLVDDYLQALLATRRLYPEDRHLLTQELIPRLDLTPGTRARQLGAEQLSDDPDLCRQVFGGRSDGTGVDGSLGRLVDARILVSHRHESPPYIELRHGLIYEHLIGQRLYAERIRAAPDAVAACRSLIDATDSAGEAWSAVKRAVYLAFRQRPQEMQALAFIDSVDAAHLVKSALLELGACDPDQARPIVQGIARCCQHWPRSRPQRRAWLGAEIALAAAAQLDDRDVFLALLAARDARLGEMAVNDVYLWGKSRPDGALDVAQALGARITRSRWVIDRRALNAALFLIPLLAIDCWEHEGLRGPRLDRLRAICCEIVAGVDRHAFGWAFRGLARNRIAAGAVSVGYRLLQEGASIGALDDAASYQRFFQRPAEVRQRAREALAWIDRSHGPLEDAVDLLAGLYASQDHLSGQIGDAIIMARGIHRSAEVEPVLWTLLERVVDPGHGIEAHMCSCWCESAIRQGQIDAHTLRVMAELVSRALDACGDGYGVVVRAGHVRRYRPLHYYMRLWVRVRPNEPVDLVERYLRQAADEQNDELLRHVIESYADALNLSNHCGAMLRPLAPYVNQGGLVGNSLANSLAAIRGFQPALVDRFLLDAEAPHALQQEVYRRTRERPRRWHYIGLLGLAQDFIAYAPPPVMQSMLSVWHAALGAGAWPQAAARLAAGMLDLLRSDSDARRVVATPCAGFDVD